MAWPWLSNTEDNVETGILDTAVWNGTNSDAGSRRFIQHYSWTAKHGTLRTVPWSGAYCHHVDLSLNTTAAYLESTRWATALGGSVSTVFHVFLSTDLVMATNDRSTLFRLQSAGPVDEGVVGFRFANGVYSLYAAETAAGTVVEAPISLGRWHTAQLVAVVDSGAGNDGALSLYVNGILAGTLSSLDQAAVTQARFGVMDQDAGTTRGQVLLDHILADSERIPDAGPQFPRWQWVTKSMHAALGPGQIERVQLIDNGSNDAVLEIFDTDRADTNRPLVIPKMQYNQTFDTATAAESVGYFDRGCFLRLTGTDPQVHIAYRFAYRNRAGAVSIAHQRGTP